MIAASAPSVVVSEVQIDALLLGLNRSVHGADELRAWATRTSARIERLIATDSLVYVRLAGADADGSPIVLMLLDGVWERAV